MIDEQLLEPIPATAKRLSVGRSLIYELLAANELEAVKIGRSRRVVVESARNYVERLRQKTPSAQKQITAS